MRKKCLSHNFCKLRVISFYNNVNENMWSNQPILATIHNSKISPQFHSVKKLLSTLWG